MATWPTLPGLTWSVHKTPTFATKTQTTASSREARVANWSYPVWKFELRYNVLRDDRTVAANSTPASPNDELKQLLGFFLSRRGAWDVWYYDDPTDDLIADTTRQTIGTGTGTQTQFVVPRSYGGFVEPVGRIATSPAAKIYVNGILQGSGYTLNSPYDGWITFNVAPGNGLAIVWSGNFLHRVRFEKDELDFEQFMYDLYALKKVQFRTARP